VQATAKAAHEAYFARPRQRTLNTASYDGWQSGVRVDGRDTVQVAVQQLVALLQHPAIKVDQAQTDGVGFTPLIMAAYKGRHLCVELLLDAGADRTIAMTGSTFGGKTAVDAARIGGHESIVALLGGGGQ
jgi:hypothetical protein